MGAKVMWSLGSVRKLDTVDSYRRVQRGINLRWDGIYQKPLHCYYAQRRGCEVPYFRTVSDMDVAPRAHTDVLVASPGERYLATSAPMLKDIICENLRGTELIGSFRDSPAIGGSSQDTP